MNRDEVRGVVVVAIVVILTLAAVLGGVIIYDRHLTHQERMRAIEINSRLSPAAYYGGPVQ